MVFNNNEIVNLNSNLFSQIMENLIKENKIEEVIETGTFNGLGSTMIFAKIGIKTQTIESCLSSFFAAKDNLKNYSNVILHHGSSLRIQEMLDFIDQDDFYSSSEIKTQNISIDGGSVDAKSFYKDEVTGFGYSAPPKEDILFNLINNPKKQLIFLDSAGGVGFLEFKKFMSIEESFRKNKILVLDDVAHIKHYRSVSFLKENKYNVSISSDKRFAYCIF
jgi:hypothetical protein